MPPVHPGEILREHLLKPLRISINRLGRDRYFGTTPEFWMNLQAAYDLDSVQRLSAERIARDVHPREAA